MKETDQGREVERDKEFFENQKNDPVVLVSNSVWKGIGFIGINALILLPAAYFYELLPESIRLVATPNAVLLFGFFIGAIVFIVVTKIASYLDKKKSQ